MSFLHCKLCFLPFSGDDSNFFPTNLACGHLFCYSCASNLLVCPNEGCPAITPISTSHPFLELINMQKLQNSGVKGLELETEKNKTGEIKEGKETEEILGKKRNAQESLQEKECAKHKDSKLIFLCLDCKELICPKCGCYEHLGHKFSDKCENIVQEFRKETKDLLQGWDKISPTVKKLIKTLQEEKMRVVSNAADCLEKVETYRCAIVDRVTDICSKAVSFIKANEKSHVESIEDLLNCSDMHQENISHNYTLVQEISSTLANDSLLLGEDILESLRDVSFQVYNARISLSNTNKVITECDIEPTTLLKVDIRNKVFKYFDSEISISSSSNDASSTEIVSYGSNSVNIRNSKPTFELETSILNEPVSLNDSECMIDNDAGSCAENLSSFVLVKAYITKTVEQDTLCFKCFADCFQGKHGSCSVYSRKIFKDVTKTDFHTLASNYRSHLKSKHGIVTTGVLIDFPKKEIQLIKAKSKSSTNPKKDFPVPTKSSTNVKKDLPVPTKKAIEKKVTTSRSTEIVLFEDKNKKVVENTWSGKYAKETEKCILLHAYSKGNLLYVKCFCGCKNSIGEEVVYTRTLMSEISKTDLTCLGSNFKAHLKSKKHQIMTGFVSVDLDKMEISLSKNVEIENPKKKSSQLGSIGVKVEELDDSSAYLNSQVIPTALETFAVNRYINGKLFICGRIFLNQDTLVLNCLKSCHETNNERLTCKSTDIDAVNTLVRNWRAHLLVHHKSRNYERKQSLKGYDISIEYTNGIELASGVPKLESGPSRMIDCFEYCDGRGDRDLLDQYPLSVFTFDNSKLKAVAQEKMINGKNCVEADVYEIADDFKGRVWFINCEENCRCRINSRGLVFSCISDARDKSNNLNRLAKLFKDHLEFYGDSGRSYLRYFASSEKDTISVEFKYNTSS